MSDWPSADQVPFVVITPWSPESVGSAFGLAVGVAPALVSAANTVWPAANRAIYVPFALSRTILAVKLFTVNGGTVAGNVDIGLYGETGTLIVSSGSTAQAGTNVLQAFDIADTPVGPGVFYLALSASSGTAQFKAASTASALILKMTGMAEEASALPLPAVATMVTVSAAFVPVFGLTARSLI